MNSTNIHIFTEVWISSMPVKKLLMINYILSLSPEEKDVIKNKVERDIKMKSELPSPYLE